MSFVSAMDLDYYS